MTDELLKEKGEISTKENLREQDVLFDLPIAMAYVPWQKWEKIYDVQKGFQRGTIFEKLEKPFRGKGGCNR